MENDITESRAYKFAELAAREDNPRVGRYVRAQARRWLDILNGKTEGVFVDGKRCDKICRLLKIMVHPDLNCSMYEGIGEYAIFFIRAIYRTHAMAMS